MDVANVIDNLLDSTTNENFKESLEQNGVSFASRYELFFTFFDLG